jgi:hypothetical protein
MNTINFWQKWLFAVSLIMVVFGLSLALFYGTPLFDWLRFGVNSAFWSNEGQLSPAIQAFQCWTVGLMGIVMACWGLTVAFISYYPFRRLEYWSWLCLACGVGLWFVMDESLTLFYQVYFNALFNLGFLLLLVLPLAFTRSHFLKVNRSNL